VLVLALKFFELNSKNVSFAYLPICSAAAGLYAQNDSLFVRVRNDVHKHCALVNELAQLFDIIVPIT